MGVVELTFGEVVQFCRQVLQKTSRDRDRGRECGRDRDRVRSTTSTECEDVIELLVTIL